MKKIINIILVAIILTSFLSVNAFANEARYELPFEVDAKSYVLVSIDTGEIILEKNMHEEFIPASLTKLMTSYLAFKYIDDLDNTMITAPRYIYDELYGMGGSTADIWAGETLSARDLLYATLLPSANEAASILADYLGGGNLENFFMMMNTEAEKLGMDNTNFTNAHGLFFDDHYTSAYDMYLLAKACYETPGFMEIATSTQYTLPVNTMHSSAYNIYSSISMQYKSSEFYQPYINGMKTGSLPEVGNNFVTVCKDNGESYILVVIGADDYKERASFYTTDIIMSYFFENYTLRSANSLDLPAGEVQLKYTNETDALMLYPNTEVMSVLPNNVDHTSFQVKTNLPDFVTAPIEKGDVVGSIEYYLAGELVGVSELAAAQSYERDILVYLIEKVGEIFSSLYFWVVIAVTLTLGAVYSIYIYSKINRQKKMNKIIRKKK